MMKSLFLLIAFVLLSSRLFAQENPDPARILADIDSIRANVASISYSADFSMVSIDGVLRRYPVRVSAVRAPLDDTVGFKVRVACGPEGDYAGVVFAYDGDVGAFVWPARKRVQQYPSRLRFRSYLTGDPTSMPFQKFFFPDTPRVAYASRARYQG